MLSCRKRQHFLLLHQPVFSDEERKALEDKIAAAEAKAQEFEQKAQELEANADNIVKTRSDKMKTALNKKLQESKEIMEKAAKDEKEKLQAEFDLRLEQERAIWKAENASAPAPAPPEQGAIHAFEANRGPTSRNTQHGHSWRWNRSIELD